MNGHRHCIRKKKKLLLYEHFNNNGCNMSHCVVQPIEQIVGNDDKAKSLRLKREAYWIKELRTLTPYGLNDRLDFRNWRLRSRDDIVGLSFNNLSNVRGCRGNKSNRTKKNVKPFDYNKFLLDLKSFYINLKNWRLHARKTVNSLSTRQLVDTSWIFVELSFDSKTTYPKEITNLVLDMINFRLFLAKEKRQDDRASKNLFLKVYFRGKEVEKVKLASIFRKHLDCIPNSIQSRKTPPTLIYERSRKIGCTIFNYKNTVSKVIAKDWDEKTSFTCDCLDSTFCDSNHGHVVTGDLRIIKNRKLRSLLCKGPTFREPIKMNWERFLTDFQTSLENCIKSWAEREEVDSKMFGEWKDRVLIDVRKKIRKLSKIKNLHRGRNTLSCPSSSVRRALSDLQKKYVFVPTDKASNNIAVICKKFYIQKSLEELGIIQHNESGEKANNTYMLINDDPKKIILRHKRYMKTNFSVTQIPECFPFLYWIPKMHKKPYSKQRYIAASYKCTTKFLSATLTKCLKLIEEQHRLYCRRYNIYYNINPMWIIKNSRSIFEITAKLNSMRNARNVRTYDFSTLYTSIPHNLLKNQLSWVIKLAFNNSGKPFISVYNHSASWTKSTRKKDTLVMNCGKVIRVLNWLLDNIFVTFGDKLFRQVVGIPMGTDCSPFLANLFLYSYEFKWIDKQRRNQEFKVLNSFRNCGRYIDDLLLINNDDRMLEFMTEIYPSELVLNPENLVDQSCSFLDFLITIKDHIVTTNIFDKRDTFNFPIVNFPNLTGNIPLNSSYGVFVGELVRYARACTFYEDFRNRMLLLIAKLMKQAFCLRKLKASYFKFLDNHILLVQKYGPRILSFPSKVNN